jgi:glyoxylase-like metal-dependent hydrolase (beta-lactamase superfamily II)
MNVLVLAAVVLFATLLVVAATGCATPAPSRPSLEPDVKRETLTAAALVPHAAPITLLATYASFAADGKLYEGLHFFHDQAAARPDEPLLLALEGVCQAKLANDVGFFQRIDWVNDAVKKLDDAVAKEKDPLYERWLRGIVLAELPEGFFHKAAAAVEDLTWTLENQARLPVGFLRNTYRALAKADTSLEKLDDARAALAKSGYATFDDPQFTTDFWVTKASGFHYGTPALVERAPGIYSAEAFDFSDFFFVVTKDGVVAVDAGFNEQNVKPALDALRKVTPLPITHVIVTHAHYDHIGGIGALLGKDTQVIASARYEETLRTENERAIPYAFFYGLNGKRSYALHPTHVVKEKESMSIGGVDFVLHPVSGGETSDALMIELPVSGTLIAGDVFMPYLGGPFFNEGSPEGLLDVLAYTHAVHPKLVLHGHTALNPNFPASSLDGLEAALRETYATTLEGIRDGATQAELLARAPFPKALAAHPESVIPYVACRQHFIERIFRQHTGYWSDAGEGLAHHDAASLAKALDLVAGRKEGAFIDASDELSGQGDYSLALEIADAGLAAHPKSAALAASRARALTGLRLQTEATDPFAFFIYSEWAGAELSQLPASAR